MVPKCIRQNKFMTDFLSSLIPSQNPLPGKMHANFVVVDTGMVPKLTWLFLPVLGVTEGDGSGDVT